MTSAEPLVYYPAYCFHLSPTINKWCPLRAIDIHGLECRPGFEADNVFFSLNHPIRWVRIVGVVVAIDEFYGNRIYTIDDSTGECIDCSIKISKPADDNRQNSVGYGTNAVTPAPDPLLDIDVGMVVEAKGSTMIFRDQKKIKIQKLQRVRSTNQEVQFWNKIHEFRNEVLSRPWVLERKEVRRCKKQHMADVDAEERKKKKKRENGYTLDKSVHNNELAVRNEPTKSKPTKQEPLSKPEVKDANTGGQYDALGL
ncbi:uncharacterized protein GGS22DRAFT_92495 [Annulohypoxylon maeteangense]|uniref:uncharacterized protein n=1 Tax=Annulohypoxylon maeteangense TaxID=1927788 RepID=UPI00200843A3|nr:uncharacterized protein GGS22DRAFT_92495 [Annulohypoxylon maeteangense]KAI0888027.1 hypothetical protein GGS22DRAFT_92495 [Annulohypoxylon maeteangense]